MAFKVTRDDGATWNPEAGGYVKDGKVVSTTPEYSGSSSSSNSSKSGSSSKSSSSKSSTGSTSGTSKTYVKDAQGNIYERKYNKEAGTYVDYYVAPASQAHLYNPVEGNPDKNSGYRPGNYDPVTGTFYDPSSPPSSTGGEQNWGWQQQIPQQQIPPQDTPYGLDFDPMDIYKEIMRAVKRPKLPSWEEYVDMATKHINPMFQQNLTQLTQATDAKNIASGFYGQLPGEAMKKELQGSLMNERDANIMNLAYQMQQGDKAVAEAAYQRDLSTYLKALDYATARSDKAYGDIMDFLRMGIDQEKFDWQKKKDIAEFTGIWDGQYTLDYIDKMTRLGIDQEKAKSAIEKARADIAQGWERLSEQKKQRLFNEGITKEKYITEVIKNAYDITESLMGTMYSDWSGLTIDTEEYQENFGKLFDDVVNKLKGSTAIGDLYDPDLFPAPLPGGTRRWE
ncbi:MAG TPA: hypothetical protein PK684_04300 [Bacillota bacterium]|nr:hypothetical protein [Bacillota bacterium]